MARRAFQITLALLLAFGLAACEGESDGDADTDVDTDTDSDTDTDGLPFTLQRTDVGDPLTDQEIEDFTRRLVGYWKKVDYFQWVERVSHGVHESTGKPDYAVWWGETAYKEGNTIRMYHSDPDGGGHNIMIPTPRVLSSAIAGYLLTEDPKMAWVAEQYCKGITATMKGMVYDDSDPLPYLMARNIATISHTYTTEEGYSKEIDYTGWHTSYEHWNTDRFEYTDNPFWGSVWVTNMRSKDDVPHLYGVVPHLMAVAADAPAGAVKEACAETLEYMRGWTKDIVDSGYHIRTKDKDGNPYIPGQSGDPERDKDAGDLASFVDYEEPLPGSECNAMRTSALIGYGNGQGNDCGEGGINSYEEVATSTHYYNAAIVRFFHQAHIANALYNEDNDAARILLQGMIGRLDTYHKVREDKLPKPRSEWENDLALLALRSAAFGLPLTSKEARMIVDKWGMGVDEFKGWANYNLWDAAIAEGQQSHRPGHTKGSGEDRIDWTRIEDMALPLEYCWSKFKNPAGVKFIDCDIVMDPTQWDATVIDD